MLIFRFKPPSDEVLIDIVDSEWRNDKLPSEDIHAPIESTLDSEGNENEGSNRDQVNNDSELLS